MNLFGKKLRELETEGLFDEYSSDHVIKKAMIGNYSFFQKHKNLIDIKDNSITSNLCKSFLLNLSNCLNLLYKKFDKVKIDRFIKDQLSAGKDQYDEMQFIRAISEIEVIRYFLLFISKNIKAIYEPTTFSGKKNPEARFIYDDKYIIDIEVKTPGFNHIIKNIPDCKEGCIRPNVILPQKFSIKDFFEKNNINMDFEYPRCLKLKEYIKSAASKFENVDHQKHFNLLFVNWTYSDYNEVALNEPITLIANSYSGIFINKKAYESIGIKQEEIERISGIVLYKDSFDNIINMDLRYHFRTPNTIVFIPNSIFLPELNLKKITEMIKINPLILDSVISEINILDYVKRRNCKVDLNLIAKYLVRKILSDRNLGTGLGLNVFNKNQIEKIINLIDKIN